MNRIQDIKAFEELIIDTLNEYAEYAEQYPQNAVMQINSQSKEITIDTQSNEKFIDNISLSELIDVDNNDIDYDAINTIANKYFFVR